MGCSHARKAWACGRIRAVVTPQDPAPHPVPPSAPPQGGRTLAAWPLARAVWLLGAAVALAAAGLGGLVALALHAWGFVGAVAAGGLGAAVGTLVVGLPALRRLREAAQRAEALAQVAVVPDRRQGAAPREFLRDLAEREFARARRYGTGAALLIVEVDRWGRPGERTQGPALQALLNALATEVAPTLRGADVLAHHDPAQLAVFLVQADPTGALDVAERIRERAEQLAVPWMPEPLRFTVSVGVAHLRSAHQSVDALFEDAVDAVQAAREVGGNCVRAAPVERRAPLPGSQPHNGQRTQPGA